MLQANAFSIWMQNFTQLEAATAVFARSISSQKIATNKVRDDAVHFIVGFEHEPRGKNGRWKFTRWDLVDLARFKVKMKAEFQGSNHDMYRPEAIVASGRGD